MKKVTKVGGRRKPARIVFVTGTDTGVGKTVLTCLLLAHLRGEGMNALALKPFCSGGREDAEALWGLEKECLTVEEVNPFYFDGAVAPRAAAMEDAVGGTPTAAGGTAEVPLPTALPETYKRWGGATELPRLEEVVKRIEAVAARCDVLLIEGSGGLLVPLGVDYTVADLIAGLKCDVVAVGRNALGTINHTLLTIRHLQRVGIKGVKVVLMAQRRPDASAATNLPLLVELAPETCFFSLPFLGDNPLEVRHLKKSVTFLKKTLAQISGESIVCLPARKGG